MWKEAVVALSEVLFRNSSGDMEEKSWQTFVRKVGRQTKIRTEPSRIRTSSAKLLTATIKKSMPQRNRSNTYALQRLHSAFYITSICRTNLFRYKSAVTELIQLSSGKPYLFIYGSFTNAVGIWDHSA